MKKTISLLLAFVLVLNLCCFFVTNSYAAQNETYTLECTIRDFDPVNSNYPERNHPDFENEKYFDTITTGAVKSRLGSDNTPIYAESGYSVKIITSEDSFYDWYHDTNKNISIPYDMVFTKSGSMYTFDSTLTDGFFPINNKGFGNYQDNKNYHFTMELHTKFVFQYGQVFNLAGDDDVWLFINKELVGDLGGIHETQYKTVNVDNYISSMDLEPGDVCTLDLFFAERHVSESNLKISTNIELFNNYTPVEDEEDNERPIADAGSNQTKTITGTKATITLDGSDSSDPDLDRLTLRWTNEDNERIASGETPQIELPVGTHRIKLTVSDGDLTDTDTVVIYINKDQSDNEKPVADAGSNKTIMTDKKVAEVTLNGSGSYDPDGDSLSYKWEDESGITIGKGVKPDVLLPIGKNKITLIVSDSELTDTDTVIYTVEEDEIPGSSGDTDLADLGITLKSDQTKVVEGSEILFTINYVNKTNKKTPDVEVDFILNDGMKVVEADDGNVSGNTITWDVGDLDGNEKGQIKFKVETDIIGEAEVIENFVANITSNDVELANTYDDTSKLGVMVYSNRYLHKHTRYILGYPDKTFKGERNITRAETAVIFARILNLQDLNVRNASQFVDVEQDFWADDHIYAAVQARLFKGIDSSHFNPNVPITRAEFATVIANYLEISRTKEEVPLKYTFNDIKNHWAQGNIEEIARYNIVNGYSDGSFRPQKQISRQEAVTMINRLLYRGPLTNVTNSFPDMTSNHWAFGDIEESVRSHEYVINENGEEVRTEFIEEPIW